MMIKRILFFACFFFVMCTVVSNITTWSTCILVVSAIGIYLITRNMTGEEFYNLTGANLLNKMFNTNEFTEE